MRFWSVHPFVTPRSLRALLLAVGFCIPARGANAQDASSIDISALPLLPTPSPFVSVRGAGRTEETHLKMRVSYLDRPIELRLASSSPDGTSSRAVRGVFLADVAASFPIIAGFDGSLSLGAHVYQWGHGTDAVSGSDTGLRAFGASDPRLELGWAATGLPLFLRPYVGVLLPFGNERAFAGEPKTRFEIGISLGYESRLVTLGCELDFLYRLPTEMGSITWGPQLRGALAAQFHFTEQLSLGPELFVAPVAHGQPQPRTVVLPAEALLALSWAAGHWNLRAAAGSGLPLSHFQTAVVDGGLVRGPTSPVFRTFLEATVELGRAASDALAPSTPPGAGLQSTLSR